MISRVDRWRDIFSVVTGEADDKSLLDQNGSNAGKVKKRKS